MRKTELIMITTIITTTILYIFISAEFYFTRKEIRELKEKILNHKIKIEQINIQEIKDKFVTFNYREIELTINEKNKEIELSYEYSTGWNGLLRVYPLQKIEEFKHNY